MSTDKQKQDSPALAVATGSKAREDEAGSTDVILKLSDCLREIESRFGSFEAFFDEMGKRERLARSNVAGQPRRSEA